MITSTFPSSLVELRDSPIDVHDIELKVRDFFLAINFEDDYDIKQQCLDARNHLDSARIIVRNLLVLEENEYIKKYSRAFFWMLDNLGRVDLRIDTIEEETIGKLETIELISFNKYSGTNLLESPKIRKYTNFLIKCMEHLVYYPLKKGWERFKKAKSDKEGERIVKDQDLFFYYVFLELGSSSESLGSITSQKIKTTPKQPEISFNKSSHENPDEIEIPKALPDNIRTEPILQTEEKEPEINIEELRKIKERRKTETELFGDEIIFEYEDEDEEDEEDDNENI